MPTAYVSIKAPSDIWHNRLGHLSPKITNYLARFNLVSLSFEISPTFFFTSLVIVIKAIAYYLVSLVYKVVVPLI